ncbi:MAG: prepilin-type N-terminal cleavage/methylation domain-containing protein [Actinomycetota bacterium]|nr:prepilin-type N-terminal cleavage/methylation domain-containing protein [Actinomycetota bacterium]
MRAVIISRLRARFVDEGGFTLVELLVSCVLGMIVLGGAFTVLQVAFAQGERVSQRVDTVQRGRITMEQITRQLRSQVCLGPGYPAVTQGDSNSVTFYADLGTGDFKPEQRRLRYTGSAIVEEIFPWISGTLPDKAVFASTPSGRRTLIEGVTQNVASNGIPTPIFRYFAFATTDPIRPSLLLSAPLSKFDMARTVQIDVSFLAQPLKGDPNDKVKTVFENSIFVRTSDPGDPERSPQCI